MIFQIEGIFYKDINDLSYKLNKYKKTKKRKKIVKKVRNNKKFQFEIVSNHHSKTLAQK